MSGKEGASKKSPVNITQVTTIIVLVCMLMLVILLVKINTNTHNDMKYHENAIKAELGQLENKTKDEIQETLNQIVEEGSLSISMNMNPVFLTGESSGSLMIENGPQNRYGQRVIILLDETGEEIYDSGYMPINSHIQEDKLKVNLEKGEYEATAMFTAYDEDLGTVVGQVAAKIKISILN